MEILNKYRNENFLQVIDEYNLEDMIDFSQTVNGLFVAPNSETREDMLGIFNIFFNQIDAVYTADEAFYCFENNKYDLIIISTELPDNSSVLLMEKIRNVSRNITVLALSAQEKYFIDFIRLGIDGYILRPIEVDQFVQIIYQVIDKLLNKQRLFEYRTNLENMVKEKTKALEDINNELHLRVDEEIEKNKTQQKQLFHQSKMASLGEMISNIAHQWRQPLSVITSTASTVKLTSQLDILEKDKCESLMDNIVVQAKYLSKTIDTFRNFTQTQKEYVPIKIQDKIEQVYTLIKPVLLENDIKIIDNVDYTNDLYVNAIKGEIPQVFINIINNAKDILIEKSIQEPWIKISLSHNNDTLIIGIEDNGGGIPLDIIDHIFDPYFTTKHKSQGTGLGLHMSYRIVTESLGGKLHTQNTQNGALFTIELPILSSID